MINTIIQRFKKLKPNRKVVGVYKYDDKLYLIEAPLNNGEVDYNNPFFIVDKNVTKVQGFPTTAMMTEFRKALSQPIWKEKR